jgi:hypothetical protein
MDPKKTRTLCIINVKKSDKKEMDHTFNFVFFQTGRSDDSFDVLVQKRPLADKNKDLTTIDIEKRGDLEYLVRPAEPLKTFREAKKFATEWAIRFCYHLEFKFPFDNRISVTNDTPNGVLQTLDGKVSQRMHIDI